MYFGRYTQDDSIEEWVEVGAVPNPIVTPAVAIVGNKLVVVGGLNGKSQFVGEVWSAEINQDGTLEPFAVMEAELPEGRGHVHQLPQLDGKLFMVGGRSGERVNTTGFRSLGTTWVGSIR